MSFGGSWLCSRMTVFKLLSFLLAASVINSVGVKKENVPRTQQR